MFGFHLSTGFYEWSYEKAALELFPSGCLNFCFQGAEDVNCMLIRCSYSSIFFYFFIFIHLLAVGWVMLRMIYPWWWRKYEEEFGFMCLPGLWLLSSMWMVNCCCSMKLGPMRI